MCVALLHIWSHMQLIGEMAQILSLLWFTVWENNGESGFCTKMGGPQNHPSIFVWCRSCSVPWPLPHRPGEQKWRRALVFIISTCLGARNACLLSACVSLVRLWWLQPHHTHYLWHSRYRCWFFLFFCFCFRLKSEQSSILTSFNHR